MLSRAHVLKALSDKEAGFVGFEQRAGEALRRYEQALVWFEQQSPDDLLRRLANVPRPGALPSAERVAGQSIVCAFQPHWANHQEARAWALQVLRGVPTFAVDGSQITPSGDYSVRVGAVQVGWFENCHDESGTYAKDLRFEVLAPDELMAEAAEEGGFPDQRVNLRRFQIECQVLTDYMRRVAGRNPAPVCFFDGSLILSFAAQLRPELQRAYVEAIRGVLDASVGTRVPLVGYVDTSRATDLLSALSRLRPDAGPHSLSDGVLLRRRMSWGERTEALICARDDRLFEGTNAALDYYRSVLLVYLKTTAENPPVRLDLPAWLLDAGELERVLDIVRAECVVGTGYPYAVETADAVAVITNEDRERFYRLFQDFIARHNMALRYSRKSTSKRARR